MNIYSAIRGLTTGQAIKPASWRGYVERIDKTPTDPQYSSQSSYTTGNVVIYRGARYICVTPVDSPEEFDFDKWTRIDNDRYIVFVDASEADQTDNPSAIYLLTVTGPEGDTECSRIQSTSSESVTIPDELVAVHGTWSGKNVPVPVDMPDAEMFSALISDSWETGRSADYETQRVGGGGGRW